MKRPAQRSKRLDASGSCVESEGLYWGYDVFFFFFIIRSLALDPSKCLGACCPCFRAATCSPGLQPSNRNNAVSGFRVHALPSANTGSAVGCSHLNK